MIDSIFALVDDFEKMLGFSRHLSSLRRHQCRNGAIVIKEVR